MPRYELMYILGASVSDDQIPEVSKQITQFVNDFGGADVLDTPLGKKKLAYTVKKTKNGFYGQVDFTMDSRKINELDAKIRTQGSTIVRYIIVNMDEHLERLAKDREVQAKMIRNRPVAMPAEDGVAASKPKAMPAPELDAAALDEKIEAALTEDITK